MDAQGLEGQLVFKRGMAGAPAPKNRGIQQEIVLSIALLLSAALFFTGLLLIQFAERQAVMRYVAEKERVVEVFSLLPPEILKQGLAEPSSSVRWGMMRLGGERQNEGLGRAAESMLRRTAISGEGETSLSYRSCLTPVGDRGNEVIVARPLVAKQSAVVFAYSLEEVRNDFSSLLLFVSLFILLFGGILTGYGVWLMRRRLILPIRNLSTATAAIAEGSFEVRTSEEGPREIAEVAGRFNYMVERLQASRNETEQLLGSLHARNRELLETREELVRSERLASVGHLAAGMAHEIGNPLGAMTGYLCLLREEESPEMRRELIDHLERETGRIDTLLRDLLDYSDSSRDQVLAGELPSLLHDALHLMQQQGIMKGLTLSVGDIPEVQVRIAGNRFSQVMINLLVNARDASAGEALVEIDGRCIDGMVELRVRDNGPGVPQEIAAHVFDPFFTTKGPGGGRGLGLAVCARILADAGGLMRLEQETGGATFILALPVTAEGSGVE